jgi:hypothetical protein
MGAGAVGPLGHYKFLRAAVAGDLDCQRLAALARLVRRGPVACGPGVWA